MPLPMRVIPLPIWFDLANENPFGNGSTIHGGRILGSNRTPQQAADLFTVVGPVCWRRLRAAADSRGQRRYSALVMR